MTNSTEILPCPFCGSKSVFINEAKAFQPTYKGNVGSIICPKCFTKAHNDMRTKKECIKAWNTRTKENL